MFYSEKDQAKKLGAKQDPSRKSWFIPKELHKDCFEKRLPIRSISPQPYGQEHASLDGREL